MGLNDEASVVSTVCGLRNGRAEGVTAFADVVNEILINFFLKAEEWLRAQLFFT